MAIQKRESLLTVAEAAAFLRVHINTVYNWIATGRIAYIPVGRDKRIPESEIKKGVRPVNRTETD